MIKPVQFSGWATPIAPVIKGVAVSEFVEFTNSHAAKWETKFEVYPLLKIDDFASCQAVRQIPQVEDSHGSVCDHKYVCRRHVGVTRGLFQYMWLLLRLHQHVPCSSK